jgi:hypothetical protein
MHSIEQLRCYIRSCVDFACTMHLIPEGVTLVHFFAQCMTLYVGYAGWRLFSPSVNRLRLSRK